MSNETKAPSPKKELLQELGLHLLGPGTLLITTLDSEGIITSANPLAQKLSGYGGNELVGRPWEDIFLGQESVGDPQTVSERVLSGQAAQDRTTFRAKDGTKRVASWDSFALRDAQGDPIQVVAIGRQVAEDGTLKGNVRQEWETLRDIVNNVGAGLNLLNRDRRILWTNPQMRKWFGNGHLLGSHCYKVLHEPEDSGAECPSFYTFKTKKTGSISKWVTTSDGKRRFFQFITTPILNQVSEVTHILELIIDITVRKEIEERRLESEKLATVGYLAEAVAHEIRNPMTVIGGFTRRLKKKVPDNPLVQETADIILKESRRLEDMVLKVNLFLNPKEPSYTRGDMNELISQTLKAMSRYFKEAAVAVTTGFSPDVPPVMADRNKVRQALFNLLQNAIDAMPEGGEATITTGLKGDFIEVRIQDTGPGVEEEDVDSIFHAFFSGKETGLGLGLTIASQIIHQHGGYINVEKGLEGRGALFIFGLPVYPADASGKDRAPSGMSARNRD